MARGPQCKTDVMCVNHNVKKFYKCTNTSFSCIVTNLSFHVTRFRAFAHSLSSTASKMQRHRVTYQPINPHTENTASLYLHALHLRPQRPFVFPQRYITRALPSTSSWITTSRRTLRRHLLLLRQRVVDFRCCEAVAALTTTTLLCWEDFNPFDAVVT